MVESFKKHEKSAQNMLAVFTLGGGVGSLGGASVTFSFPLGF